MKQVFLLMLAVLILFGCKKQSNQSIIPNDSQTISAQGFRGTAVLYTDFEQEGQLHNDYLTHFNTNFVEMHVTNLSAGVDYVKDIAQTYNNSLNISAEEKAFNNQVLEDSKHFVVSETFMADYVGNNGFVYEKVNDLYQAGEIDLFEKESLVATAQKSYDNHIEILSTSDLKAFIIGIKQEWESKGYLEDDKHGKILPLILSISLHSFHWWENNPDAYEALSRAIPAVVANDIAGAVVGATYQASKEVVNDDVSGGETIEGAGERIAMGAVHGAVLASSGAVTKAAKWLKSLF